MRDIITHYDLLIEEGNDPVLDPPALQEYMDQWDGDLFLELLDLQKSDRVLEIGCGTGRLALRAAPQVNTFCGIDLSPKTVERAKEHLDLSNAEILCGDFLTYPFPGKFDVIYSSLTFMHIKEKEQALQKVAALLAPGGRFVLSIDKNQADRLDYGSRSLTLYPDTPEQIVGILRFCSFYGIEVYETSLAYIIFCEV